MAADQTVIHATPATYWAVRDRLATDPTIREVILGAGIYGGISIDPVKDVDPAQHPLLLRVADGAEVIFEGGQVINDALPHEQHAGVFVTPYTQVGVELAKLWEPQRRIRYRLVADLHSVAHFPATFTVLGSQLFFHTSDGQPPSGMVMRNHPYQDYGLFIQRSHVTVRGIRFQNFLLRETWSTAIQLRGDHITLEDCRASNCSIGFTVIGSHAVLRRCEAKDVGCGVYIGGNDATIEDCRFLKRRDAFMMPMYAQDDAAVQFYYPAKGGTCRGNLCVGFRTGIFIKAEGAPYVVEHNTVDGQGQGTGFGATKWHPGQRFVRNIVVNCQREIDPLPAVKEGQSRELDHNCYWSPTRDDVKPIGPHDVVADPKLSWPAREDYRVSSDSPAVALGDGQRPAGAMPTIGADSLPPPEPRQWHVHPKGQDGNDGSEAAPVRTVQFAVDRAGPGDTILVHPGLYAEPVVITRGGEPQRPIVIRATEKWRAIFDANRQHDVIIGINGADHVEIRDLEIRWYGRRGIEINKSQNVTVAGCRIWNAHWYGAWPTGIAIYADYSPRFTAHENVLFRQEFGIWCAFSPQFTITHNTAVANLYGAAILRYGVEGSVCRYNNFTFQGNDVLVIEEAADQLHKLRRFDCDYNNYGSLVTQVSEGSVADVIKPRPQDAVFNHESKAIVNYTGYPGPMQRFQTMQAWREFSGCDQHTLFADPLFVNAAERDFRLEPGSPNIAVGSDSATIGATDLVDTSLKVKP